MSAGKSRALTGPRNDCVAIDGEEWRPVPSHKGLYSVSSLGRVRSEPRVVMRSNGFQQTVHARILRTPLNNSGTGYPHCAIQKAGVVRKCQVHRLVLEAFVGPCPAGMVACHNDGNSRNASIDNLRWDTMKANVADSIKHGVIKRGEELHSSTLKAFEVLVIRSDPRPQNQIAKAYGVTPSNISRIKSRDLWNHI